MELLIMRHADAVDGNGNDFQRVLTEKGQKQAEKMGDWLKDLKMPPDAAATSPLLRARETADIVMKRLGGKVTARSDERLACGMTANDAAGIVHEMGVPGKRLLMVGHAPDLGNLISYLLGAREGTVEMRKGAVACLQMDRAGHAGSVLRWLITPKL